MEKTTQSLLIVLAIILLGNAIQTFKLAPSFFDAYFDLTATKLTVAAVVLAASAIGLMIFLQNRNREGFQTPSPMEKWKQLQKDFSVAEVCALKKNLDSKVFAVMKGEPPNEISAEQARERTNKVFEATTRYGVIDCELVELVNKAKDIDSFFEAIQRLPTSFCVQVYDTVKRMSFLLENQYKEFQKEKAKAELEKKKNEGFIDRSVGICSPAVVEERRKFLREKKLDQAAQSCLLPEEVPLEEKETIASNHIQKMLDFYGQSLRPPNAKLEDLAQTPTIQEMMEKSLKIAAFFDKNEKDAKEGKLFKPLE